MLAARNPARSIICSSLPYLAIQAKWLPMYPTVHDVRQQECEKGVIDP